jgi:hypothetical protein
LVILVGLLAVVLRSAPNESHGLEGALVDASRTAGSGRSIDIAQVVDVRWDRAFVVGPYASEDDVSRCLGFEWFPEPRLWGDGFGWIMPSEGFNLLVFVAGDQEVTAWTILKPGGYDLPPYGRFAVDEGECLRFTPDTGRFHARDVSSGKDGNTWLLEPAEATVAE